MTASASMATVGELAGILAQTDQRELSETLKRVARSKNTTAVREVVALSVPELLQLTHFASREAAAQFLVDLSFWVVSYCGLTPSPPVPTVRLSLGCPVLDAALRGGIPVGRVVEVCGESACGKTQLCLQLCLTAQLPVEEGGLNGAALFLSTEGGGFPDSRFQQMAAELNRERGSAVDFSSSLLVNNLLQDGLMKLPAVLSKAEELCQRMRVRLVVIDSVAALYRTEYSRDEAPQKAQALWELARWLHFVARKHNLAAVVVNQVTDVVGEDDVELQAPPSRNEPMEFTSVDPAAGREISPLLVSRRVAPALGLSWSNCVDTRILVSRTSMTRAVVTEKPETARKESDRDGDQDPQDDEHEVVTPVRKLQVVFSPDLPNLTSFFVVTSAGVRGLEDSQLVV